MHLPNPAVSLADRIARLRAELAALEQQQRDELRAVIVITIGSKHCFNAKELFDYRVISPALAAAFVEHGITSVRKLGKRLRALGLKYIGADHDGAIWTCREEMSL